MTQTIVKKVIVEFEKPLNKDDIEDFKDTLETFNDIKSIKTIRENNSEKHWRHEFGCYYYEDNKYGYAYIHKDMNTEMFFANINDKMKSKDFKKLSEAKKWVESFYTKKKRKS